jgi:5-methylcytosine-specific restriction endonuclease McrA
MGDLIQNYNWINEYITVNKFKYSVPDFCLLIIKYEQQQSLAKFLGCSPLTIQRNIDKYIPELVKFKRPRTPLVYRLYSLFEHKYCTKCAIAQPISCFATNKAQPDGLQQYCKYCIKNYYIQNKDAITSSNIKWAKSNPGKIVAAKARRRAAEKQQCPAWSELLEVQDFYERCPEGMEVDHIVPLRGKLVSGLHVLENLQYLEQSENRKKGNRFNL